MTSKILNDALLANIDVNFPVANKNNSTSGFRENFRQTRDIIRVAAQEISALQDKKIEIIGDAAGISGALGSTTAQPAPINLVLANSGVTAGTYTTSHNDLSISVDSKGRIVSFTTAATPTRPAVVGEWKVNPTSVTSTGFVKEATSPVLTFDTYGTLTLASTNTLKFGVTGHPLAKGSLLVGTTAGESTELVAPSISYNSVDTWVLAWRPEVGNDFGLAWFKLPAPPAPNPAQVITVLPAEGITVSSDPQYPAVGFDFTSFTAYPESSAIQTGTQMLMWDPATNGSYKVDIAKIFTIDPTSGQPVLLRVKDDLTPELGGDLEVKARKIKSSAITGVQIETTDSGPFVFRNVKKNQNGLPLDPSNYIVSEQRLPLLAPSFTAAETAAGITTATMKSNASGQMYWDKTPAGSGGGVQMLLAGAGISFDPTGVITDQGVIQIDYTAVQVAPADVYSDFILVQQPGNDLIRSTVSDLTLTLRRTFTVDPLYGSDEIIQNRGQLHAPFATIGAAMSLIEDGNPDSISILLLPGTYVENFDITKPNVRIRSLMGPEQTVVRGGVNVSPGMGTLGIEGISFDISNLQVDVPDRILTASTGIETLTVTNCWFYQEFTEQGRPQEIISLSGDQTGNVLFDHCKFNGKFINYLQFDNDNNAFTDGRVRITNTISDIENLLYLTVGNLTQTELSNVNLLGQITHVGGIIDAKNIGGILGDFAESVWAANPDEEDLDSLGYIREGIQSSANANSANTNFMTLTNVCLRNYLDHTYYITSSIQKTGSCQWTFANVQRKPDIDLINGLRYDNHGTPKTDISDQVKSFTGTTGAIAIDTRMASTWSFELDGDTQFTFKSFETSPNPYTDVNQSVNFRVSIKQGASAYAVTWTADTGTIVWDGGAQPATVSLTTGGYGVYEFIRINNIWFAKRIFAS